MKLNYHKIIAVSKNSQDSLVSVKLDNGNVYLVGAIIIAISKGFRFYTEVDYSNVKNLQADVIVVEGDNNRGAYLRSVPTGYLLDNLDNLPIF